MRKTLARALLIVVTLFVVVIYYVPIGHVDFAENWGEGTFGIVLPPQRLIVSVIEPDSAADRAGVRAGDRLVTHGNYELPTRVRSPYPGERETLTFERGGVARTVTLDGSARSELQHFGAHRRCARVSAADSLSRRGVLARLFASVDNVLGILSFCRWLLWYGPCVHVLVARVVAIGILGTQLRVEHGLRAVERPAAAAIRSAFSQWRRAWVAPPHRPFRVDVSRPVVRGLCRRVANVFRHGFASALGRRSERHYSALRLSPRRIDRC